MDLSCLMSAEKRSAPGASEKDLPHYFEEGILRSSSGHCLVCIWHLEPNTDKYKWLLCSHLRITRLAQQAGVNQPSP